MPSRSTSLALARASAFGIFEHEQAVGAGLAHEPHRADAALAERLHQLVALDDLGLVLLRPRGGGRPPDRAAHRGFEQREVTGPSDASHTSSIERLARAESRGRPSAAMRGAFSIVAARERLVALVLARRCSALHRDRRARPAGGRRRATSSTHSASTSGLWPAAAPNVVAAPRRGPRARAAARSPSACSDASASRRGAAPLAVGAAERRPPCCSASALLAAAGRAPPRPSSAAPSASCSRIAGRSITSAHHAANGPSHSTSSTSPERRAARRVHEAPEQRAQHAAERRAAARASRRSGPRACAARGACRAPSGRGRGRGPRLRRRRRARSRRAASPAPRSGRIGRRDRRPRSCRRSATRSRISAGASAIVFHSSARSGSSIASPSGRVAAAAPEAQREGSRAALDRVDRGGALARPSPSPARSAAPPGTSAERARRSARRARRPRRRRTARRCASGSRGRAR